MSDTYEPQPYDRVRVSYIDRVSPLGEFIGKHVRNQVSEYAVELIERADDPSKDPVGTVAVVLGDTVVKVRRNSWYCFQDSGYEPLRLTDQMVEGRKVVGVTPRTLAAEKQAADELSRQQGDEERKPEGYPFPVGTKVRGYRPWTEQWETGYLIKPRFGHKPDTVTVGKTPDSKSGNYLRASDLERVFDPFEEEPW